MKSDIATREDVKVLVDRFYDKVKEDELLGPVFSHVDWPHHLPIMYNFWSSMLLGDQSYRGNPFQKHISLPIDNKHFNQWLKLFRETVHEHLPVFSKCEWAYCPAATSQNRKSSTSFCPART